MTIEKVIYAWKIKVEAELSFSIDKLVVER